jgi:uncharacterized membrane protein
MRFNWKLELPQLVLAASMLVTALVVWPSAPDRIPIHWNLEGEVDAYGGKFMGLLFLPLLSVGLYLLFLFLPRIDPGRANYSGFAGTYGVIRFSIMVVMAVIYAATLLVMRGHAVRMETIVPLLIGGMFMVLGGVIGKVRPNWFVGVRTPWTLSSKLSWTKTHRFAGWLFIGAGMLTIAGSLLGPKVSFVALMVGVAGASLGSIAYSYFVWRSDPDKQHPARTQPAD